MDAASWRGHATSAHLAGGAFLTADLAPAGLFDPLDFSPEHIAIANSAREFWTREVEPRLAAIHRKDPGTLLEAFRKSAELGFAGISIPEQYGGMELDLASVMIVEESFARDASYLVTHGAHAGIGTLPLALFGTGEQKARYLPKLATAELMAAYALTEPQAGSDALAAETRADLSADGTHYVLNGRKMWITNGAIADLFTVFAKVGGEKFTAFLVERAFPGVSAGAEEHKMGLEGSSTTAVFFDDVRVPAGNVLGEIGRGHVIAFNVLNIGRLKIGPYCVGVSKEVLATCIRYAHGRKAFGRPISEFGAIRSKLADMAVLAFVSESMYWRVVGLIESAGRAPGAAGTLEAIEEFAIESSIVKVFCSEAVGRVVDEGVQIHGGYGYHRDYAVERFYRDARIYRIFEGTNEINRLLIAGMLLKRSAASRLNLDAPRPGGAGADCVLQAKEIARAALRLAAGKFGGELQQQQEMAMAVADIVIGVFAMESASVRAEKLTAAGGGAQARDLRDVFLGKAMAGIEASAREVFAACGEAAPSVHLPLVDTIGLRRRIAERLLNAGRYGV